MRIFLVLLLVISASESIFGIKQEQKVEGNVVNAPQLYNNLKVNNQMRIKSEVGDSRNPSQSKIGKMDNVLMTSRTGGIEKQDGVNGISEVHGYNSLRTSEIIYNGTQALTLIFFISVIIFGFSILVIALVPRYARKFGFRSRRDEVPTEQDCDDSSLHDIERKVSVGREKKENSIVNGPSLSFAKVKNQSLRRHSLISDGSSDSCKIATRPRSSSSLPSVQAFTETLDESTTGDEGSTRTSKHNSYKSLKKRPHNNDVVAKIYRTNEQSRFSNIAFNNSNTQKEDEDSGLSPTSASAVVAIQMSELIARWNPKKDSRLIQKANTMTNEKNFNAS
ncbi:uncharacterized protein cubi_03216 [Cryptosporidium ubiquitum]|uniref:Uncharacterized protein n=1 Tax=Cryptosporidium ubiquitum TaxID=857276 RepID=A0A1J4MLX5_9CRYT|nr:uncharacterized protein cubi_03216 [Cryptosporidium ubiquitum]OII75200.1 hypothetical protein cubi_03216 [Cryptosporidium ubiquitum]